MRFVGRIVNMANEESPASDLEALEQHIRSLETEYANLAGAIGRGGRVRMILFLLLVVFIAVFGYLYYSAVDRLVGNPDALLAEVESQSPPTVAAITRSIQTLGENVANPVADAFQAQIEKDLPQFLDALRNERDPFIENMAISLNDRIDAQYEKLLQQHQSILEEEFPDVADKDGYGKMIGNFQIAFERLVKQHYGDEFRNEADQLAKAWEQLPPAEVPPGGEEELRSELKGLLVDLLQHMLTRKEPPHEVADADPSN
jgi:hypothetical protein